MFADIVSQSAYNFWDRIGDMIASFFPDRIKSNQIYFSTAMDNIPIQFRSSENYLWLDNFQKTEYKTLNEIRKQVVHYNTIETNFKYEHLNKGFNNKEEMRKIQEDREALPDFYRKHIALSLDGTSKTLSLLEEISNNLFIDIT